MTTLLVTGGGGFVMAHVLRHWLEADAGHRAVCLDAVPLDAAAAAFLAPVRGRLEVVQGDVAAAETWSALPDDIVHVVHGAAMTPHAHVDADGMRREPEREASLRVIETNILGTARALDWARGLPGLGRFVHVSTGSVYLDDVPAQRTRPFALPEDGYLGPRGLYDITKLSSELIVRRLAELHGVSAVSVRLSNVFGPLDRPTPFRNVRNPANVIAHAAAEGRSVTVVDPDVPGDYIYAPDVAEAIRLLLAAPGSALAHDVYNIAYGAPALVRDLLAFARQASPGLAVAVAPPDRADIALDMGRSTGRWGAYDIGRATRDFGWRPRPLAESMARYIAWLRQAARS